MAYTLTHVCHKENSIAWAIDKRQRDMQPQNLSAMGKNNIMAKLPFNVCEFTSCKISACK